MGVFTLKRNYGIDLLRMVLMFMVVLLHVLGHGGVLDATEQLTLRYSASWLLETLGFCSVNCYAIISGYVYYNRKYRLSSFAQIWLQALIYSLGIAICVWISKPECFSIGDLIDYVLPVSTGRYWYFTAYAGLFVLIPFLNAGVNAFSEEKAKKYLFLLFCVFTIIPTLARIDTFFTHSGYSTFWLAYLYVFGACLKKYEWGEEIQSSKAALVYIGCVLLSWGIKIGCEGITAYLLGDPKTGFNFIAHNSPTMVIAAISLFLAFKKCRIPQKMIRCISEFSPAAFGVYLIHDHDYIRTYVISDKFAFLTELSVPLMIVGIIGSAMAIFLCCLLIDWIRHKIFVRIHVKEHIERLENKFIHYSVSVK